MTYIFVLFQFHPLIPTEFLLFYSVPIPLSPTPLPISFYSRVFLGGLLNLDQMHVRVSGKVRMPKTPPPAVGPQTSYLTSQRLGVILVSEMNLTMEMNTPSRVLYLVYAP